MSAELPRYLARIGHDRPVRVDLDTLTALHRAHRLAIPYENLDVQLGRPLDTDPEAAFEKLVGRRRGGWCYEMNGTLGLALQLAGFEVTRLSGEASQPDSHLVLTVALDGETWACDVGFGDGPADPFRLAEGPFSSDGFDFALELLDADRWRFNNHRFAAAKGFVAGLPNEAAMAARCQWLQTDPASTFVQHAVLFRRREGGFVSLIDRTLREVTPAGVATSTIADADAYVGALQTRFGLDLPEAASLWPALCERHEAYLHDAEARRAAAAAG